MDESIATPLGAPAEDLEIDCDFPGGSVIVERVEGTNVHVRPDLHDTSEWWFYWYFRVRGARGKTITFVFADDEGYAPVLGVLGPAISTDGGRTWRWLGSEAVGDRNFTYTFGSEEDIRFCVTIPYVQSNLQQLLARHRCQGRPPSIDRLCMSKKGRVVQRLRLGNLGETPPYRVLITARHHACESMASYVLDGIIDAIADDTPSGHWLRENVEFLVIPFVDKDGVEEGDQGKCRVPHDHGDDYGPHSIYPEVQALRQYATEWSRGRIALAVDLHCPELSDSSVEGDMGEYIYFVGSEDQSQWQRAAAFSKILESAQAGELQFDHTRNLPIGQDWNIRRPPEGRTRFTDWAAELPGIYLAALLEFPYANVGNVTVTPERAAAFGGDLVSAIHEFMRLQPPAAR